MSEQALVKVSAKDLKANKSRGRPPGGGASDFIRKHAEVEKARDLVALGAEQGLRFSTNLVYLVRSRNGSKAAAPGLAASKTLGGSVAPASGKHSLSETEELARLILAVGFDRAESMIARLRAAIG